MSETEHVADRQRHGIWSVTLAILGCLWLLTVLMAPTPPDSERTPAQGEQRQAVVVFVVDTSAAFDAHGTYVQSVIRDQCPRCSVQTVNLHGDLSMPTLVQALRLVWERSQEYDARTAVLVNLSLGTYAADEVLHAVVRQLTDAGVQILASAGNDATSQPFYPAAFPEVLAICSSTRYRQTRAAYSNLGSWVDLCAPGWQYVRRPLEHGGMASGTSFASPLVAGVLGRLLLAAPCATLSEVRQALIRTADPLIGTPEGRRAGIVNAHAAVQYLHHLYTCAEPPGVVQRWRAGLQRLGNRITTYVGLVVYFFLSIFTLPFLLAFIIDVCQRRAAQRQQLAVQRAYQESAAYRGQRLVALQARYGRRQHLPRRYHAELRALVHAAALYGEACGWCARPVEGWVEIEMAPQDMTRCQRCGMAIPDPQHAV